MSSSIFILRHIPSKTYYGTRRSCRHRRTTNALKGIPASVDHVDIRPHYNLIGFERFQDALMVADSIATHRTIHMRNPNDKAICLYPDTQIHVDAVEHDLWVTETKLTELKKMTKNRNIGLRIVYEINISDKGDLVVQFNELELKNERHTNYDFIDTLEHNFDLRYDGHEDD